MSRFAGRLKKVVTSGKLASFPATGGSLKVWLVLAANANREGIVTMSQHEIAEQAGIARASVERALVLLLKHDLLFELTPAAGRRPPRLQVIVDRHIDSVAARPGDRRRRLIHVSTTGSDSAVADSSTCQQDSVADSSTCQQVGESRSRARTGLTSTTLKTSHAPSESDLENTSSSSTSIALVGSGGRSEAEAGGSDAPAASRPESEPTSGDPADLDRLIADLAEQWTA